MNTARQELTMPVPMLAVVPSDPARDAPQDISRLKASLRRAERLGQLRAWLLILPLLAFLAFTFIVPIANLLLKSVRDTVVHDEMPGLSQALQAWDPAVLARPPEAVYAAFAADLRARQGSDGVSKVAMRLNFEEPGLRSLVLRTARGLERTEGATWRERFVALDARWDQPLTWVRIKYAATPWTLEYYVKAFDLTRDAHGAVVALPETEQLYRGVFVRTVGLSLLVAALCVLIGYPVAWFLAALPTRISNVLMILVLLPFWTSFLVRSISWMVILQSNGILNSLLNTLGLGSVALIYQRGGVLIAMTHILMPYAILSIYSVMKNVPPIYMRAARSLGAGPVRAFFSAYFPHTLPGVAAGGLLTFILAVGYYITPAMLGGAEDQLVSYYIANHVNSTLNWGLAAALATLLLGGVMLIYALFVRLTGGSGVKLG